MVLPLWHVIWHVLEKSHDSFQHIMITDVMILKARSWRNCHETTRSNRYSSPFLDYFGLRIWKIFNWGPCNQRIKQQKSYFFWYWGSTLSSHSDWSITYNCFTKIGPDVDTHILFFWPNCFTERIRLQPKNWWIGSLIFDLNRQRGQNFREHFNFCLTLSC